MVCRPLSVGEEADHALRLVRAHAGHRLVEQQQARPRRERHRDLELALLAVGEVRGEHVGARAEADLLEDRARRVAQRARRRAPAARTGSCDPACACTASATLSSAVNSR